ncbi:4'-phosphopantetheinyl transferase [Sanguibacter gelidistatuariae]|uniref:4'-phosphopantetheinyl transferase n=1 Tax=Sanguibacter gelidistatuariae TaxID=1814289 RepID=A0A1G6S6B8_9MICO|nr:4'-phosphopantetheinyl transferase superfamily protein [Sanguibacter gelidistatuariae]SDD12233.1 4'-phosphopantetheinyl transferase [Sanguibacter gelidistatuariae]
MNATAPSSPVGEVTATRLVVAWSPVGVSSAGADDTLRRVVGRFCGVAPFDIEVRRLCPSCGSSAHGRPHVTVVGRVAPHVSLSRADGLVCVAVTDAGPVGVDCERSEAAAFGDFATVGLHSLERASGPEEQTVTWVRKESLVKATGDGLGVDLRLVRLTEPADAPRILTWDALRPPDAPVWMHDIDGPEGYVLAVTVLAEVDPQVSVQPAAPAAPERRATH